MAKTNTDQTIARLQKEIKNQKARLARLKEQDLLGFNILAREIVAEIESLEWTLQNKIEIQQMEEQEKNGNGLFS